MTLQMLPAKNPAWQHLVLQMLLYVGLQLPPVEKSTLPHMVLQMPPAKKKYTFPLGE